MPDNIKLLKEFFKPYLEQYIKLTSDLEKEKFFAQDFYLKMTPKNWAKLFEILKNL
jgi:hypothetical protein